jgi:hypothetical protein
MTKNSRNYNQNYFKVGGTTQPGEQHLPAGDDKEKLARQAKSGRGRKAPPGAPGTEPDGA